MSIYNYGERYLDHKEFLKLCTDLEVNSLGNRNDEAWLELLEKEKILYPVKRIFYPIIYLKKINSIHFNPSDPQFSKYTYYLPDKYSTISKLNSTLDNFNINNDLFHILDKKRTKFKKYIRNPKRSKFSEWKNYKKFVGRFNEYNQNIDIATHLYSYWQAYYFYEITKAATMQCVVNYFEEKPNGIFISNKEVIKKIFLRKSSFKFSKKKGDFLGESKHFDALSFYVQTLNKLGNFVYGGFSKLFDKKLNERYLVLRKKITCLIIKKYRLNIHELFDFLKFLSKKYNDFNKEKKDKLVEMIKLDIDHLVLLMMEGYDLNYDEINKKLGRVIPSFKNTLDVIFPKPFAEERENVLYTLKSSLSSNLTFYNYKNITRVEIERFLKYLDSNNLQLFYYSLGKINFVQFRNESIYLYLFYLSLLFENFIKIISRKGKINKIITLLNKDSELKKILNIYFETEGWRHSLSENWHENTTIDYKTDVNVKVFNNIAKGSFHKNKEWNRIIKMFLTCGLARNIAAHDHSKVRNYNRETYLTLLNNTISAVWFTWEYAENNGYVSNISKKSNG